ncbi:MAG: RagB/SusD family nutrient uptake outer membrane protein [Prevotella sp.]|nr:RagB/SusD family nutrient uptake outer membrane protein [Candidatus Prevotella equi]
MKHYNIYNKVKNISLAFVVAVAGTGLTSCNNFLEIEPRNEITQDKFWNEKNDVDNVVTGLYSSLASNGVLGKMMVWGEFRSENIINNGTIEKDVNLERLLKENITANNGYTYWGDFYSVINKCNIVIKYAPEVASKDPSYNGSELEAHIAEVTAIRSLCYFYLIRAFRDVPYYEEAYLDDSQSMELPATPFNEVLQKLIDNLEAVKDKALTKYPEGNGLEAYYNTGRVTKNFIYALLCEMYLWQQNYDMCIHYADLIIESKKKDAQDKKYSEADFVNVNGYPLILSRNKGSNTFGNAFGEIFVTGNSMESIMEINFVKLSEGRQMSNEPVAYWYGADGRVPFVVAPSYITQDQRDGLYKIYAKENDGMDGRSYENYRFANSSPVSINKYATKGGVSLESSKETYKTAGYSALYETYGNDHISRTKSNFILYRLTDIMLLKAEAIALKITMEGNITKDDSDYKLIEEAFDLVDAVNKRSLMEVNPTHVLKIANYTTKLSILNLVYEERHRELMFEGKRYFDLVRRSMREGNTDYLSKAVVNKNPNTASVVQDKLKKMDAIFWPYNLDELKVNSNLHQNPAFGSGENSSYETSN